MREEELKNRVAADWFGAFDCSRIIGNIDFCVDIPATELDLGYDETYTSLLASLRAAMKCLAKQIEPKVYEYGFLKR